MMTFFPPIILPPPPPTLPGLVISAYKKYGVVQLTLFPETRIKTL